MKYTGVESWSDRMREREQQIKDSPRQEELRRCEQLSIFCVSCKHNKDNTGEYYTCGGTKCNVSSYPCWACSFFKNVNSGNFEDTLKAPPFPCDLYEELEKI